MIPGLPSRTLIWSSEDGGLQRAPQLTSAQKSASGVSNAIDVSLYKTLFLEIVLASITGGTTPSVQFEYDHIDGVGNAIPFIKPTAATAPTNYLFQLGQNIPSAAPTIAGWVAQVFADDFGIYGRLAWTIVGAPTAVAWQAYLFGK